MKKTFLASAIASVLTVVSVMGAEIQPLEVDYEQKAKDNFKIIRTEIDNTKFLNSQALEDFKQTVNSYIEEQYAGWNLEQTDAFELENIFSSVKLALGILPMVRHNKTLPLINAALDKAVEKLAVTLKKKEEAGNLGAIVHGNNNDNQNVDNHNENIQQAQKNNDLVQEQQDFLDANQAAEQPAEEVINLLPNQNKRQNQKKTLKKTSKKTLKKSLKKTSKKKKKKNRKRIEEDFEEEEE